MQPEHNFAKELRSCKPYSEYQRVYGIDFLLTQLMNNVRMVVRPLWCGRGNVHGFIQGGLLFKH